MSNNYSDSNFATYVSLVPQGTQTFQQRQRVVLEVPSDIAFFKGRDSYLSFDIFNNGTSRWSFPQGAGGSAVINRVDIYSLDNGQHLETLENYNQWVCIENQYTFPSTDLLDSLENVGFNMKQWNKNGNDITSYGVLASEASTNLVSQVNSDGTSNYQPRRVTLKFRTGLFKNWGDEKLTPNLILGGLRIELTLSPNNEVCQRPLAVDTDEINYYIDLRPDTTNNLQILATSITVGSTTLETVENFDSVVASGLVVGDVITLNYNSAAGQQTETLTIQSLAINNNNLEITTTTAITVAATGNAALYVVSPLSYEVQNFELKVLKMDPGPQLRQQLIKEAESNNFTFEFESYDVFNDNIPQSLTRANSSITTVATKALSLFSVLVNLQEEVLDCSKSLYGGYHPSQSNLNSVQYFINNRLYPVKDYNPQDLEERPVLYNELQKGFASIGKKVLNLADTDYNNPETTTNTFLVSRQLCDPQYYVNLLNAEPQLRLAFSATRGSNATLRHFVFSKKQVIVSKNNGLIVLK